MVDVFEQVEEELRSEKYNRLARTWLPILGVVLVIALVAALGWWGWQSWETNKAAKASEAFDRGVIALDAGDSRTADEAFAEVVKVGNSAYKAMGLMSRAGIAVGDNKIDEAVVLLDEAAKASRQPILSDTAALKAALLLMDTAPLEDIQKRLEPLVKEKRPMRAFAQEAQAMALLQHGKATEARAIFVQLQLGQEVPDEVRNRAQSAVQAIDSGTAAGLAQIVQAAKALPSAPQAAPAVEAPAAAAPAQAEAGAAAAASTDRP